MKKLSEILESKRIITGVVTSDGGSGFDLSGKIKASQFVQKKGETHGKEKMVSRTDLVAC